MASRSLLAFMAVMVAFSLSSAAPSPSPAQSSRRRRTTPVATTTTSTTTTPTTTPTTATWTTATMTTGTTRTSTTTTPTTTPTTTTWTATVTTTGTTRTRTTSTKTTSTRTTSTRTTSTGTTSTVSTYTNTTTTSTTSTGTTSTSTTMTNTTTTTTSTTNTTTTSTSTTMTNTTTTTTSTTNTTTTSTSTTATTTTSTTSTWTTVTSTKTTTSTATTTTRTTTASTTTTTTTVTSTTTTSTPICPEGTGHRLGVEDLVDPSTECAGFRLGLAPTTAWASLGGVVFLTPVLLVLALRHWRNLDWKHSHDAASASAHLGSAIIWLHASEFYGLETFVPSVVVLVLPSLVLAVKFFGSKMLHRPRALACWFRTGAERMLHLECETVWQMLQYTKNKGCNRLLDGSGGCFQLYPELDGELFYIPLNILVWGATVLGIVLGLMGTLCSAAIFAIVQALSSLVAFLTWTVVSCLWCLVITTVVMVTHITQLVPLRPVRGCLNRILGTPIDSDAELIDTNLWHYPFILQAVQSPLCLVMILVDGSLKGVVGMLDWSSWPAAVAALMSLLAFGKFGLKYGVCALCRGRQLEELPLQYTRDTAKVGKHGSVRIIQDEDGTVDI